MRSLSILAITFLFSSHSFSQSLAGEWKGGFNHGDYLFRPTPFALHISLNKDSTYRIYSYSWFESTGETVVSDVSYKMISTDSIWLEETKQVKPKKKTGCPQRFFLALKTKDGKMMMEGTWSMVPGKDCDRAMGTVFLARSDAGVPTEIPN